MFLELHYVEHIDRSYCSRNLVGPIICSSRRLLVKAELVNLLVHTMITELGLDLERSKRGCWTNRLVDKMVYWRSICAYNTRCG